MDDPASRRNRPPGDEDSPSRQSGGQPPTDAPPEPAHPPIKAGRRVILKSGVLALTRQAGDTKGTYIPAGEIVTIKQEPVEGELMVEVEWNGLVLAMFAGDVIANSDL